MLHNYCLFSFKKFLTNYYCGCGYNYILHSQAALADGMMNCSRFLVFFLSILYLVVAQNISTVPDTDDGPVYITANENEVNVTVMCTVFNPQMAQLQTPWHLRRLQIDSMLRRVYFLSNGVPNNPMEFNDDLFATGELIAGTSDTYLTTLLFLNFTTEFDTTELQCGADYLEVRTFLLGFPGKRFYYDNNNYVLADSEQWYIYACI